MKQKLIHIANRVLSKGILKKIINLFVNKNDLEAFFWKMELKNYIKWYRGTIPQLYNCPPPTEDQKVKRENELESAIYTWLNLHQKPKYLFDLMLTADAFEGAKLLDIGCGPFPSGLTFNNVDLYCLDPLLDDYRSAGFPIDTFNTVHFIKAGSENIPFEDNFFDAIISVNAIDHVNDFDKTVLEIKRVLKSNGKVALHVHSHPATMTEPLMLTEEYVLKSFNWLPNFKKIAETDEKFGWKINEKGEKYLIFRNF